MKRFKLILLLLGVTLSLTQCIDKEFDSPPLDGPTVDVPDEAVITIDQMMEQFSVGNPVALDAGSYLRGVVVGSDKSGNIFKTLIIQDETAGIAIIIDDTDLFDTYFVGREVYIKLDNLYLGDFNNLPQLGMAPSDGEVSRIPAALLPDVVLPAAYNVSVTPTPLLLGQLNDAALNTLIQIDNVEFASFELGETYATAIPAQNLFQTENRSIVNCDGFSVNLRSSGFSNFANTEVPSGNGTLYGILSKFGTGSEAYQILIRDLGDVNFTGDRCDGSSGGGSDIDPDDITDNDIMTIASVKDILVPGTATALPDDKFLQATIVANNSNGNFFRKVIVQDQTGGIEIRIDDDSAFSSFPIGSEVFVILGNLSIGEFSGLPQLGVNDGDQVNVVSNASSVLLATGNTGTISPVTLDLADLQESDLSSLVRIEGVQFLDSEIPSTYATDGNNGFHNLQDCDGNELLVFTSSFSDYTSEPVPEGKGTFVGIFSSFQGNFQLNLRDPNEVSMNDTRCDGTDGGDGGGDPEGPIDEDFESGVNFDPVSITGWDNIAAQGERTWLVREFDNNNYAQATAFNDDAPNMESYLVTPEIDFDQVTTLSFRSAIAFNTHGGLDILYSDNYSGDPNAATWEAIDAVTADENSPENDWVQSGDTDISGFSGTGHIAFRYTGSGPSGLTNSIRIDDLLVK